MLADLDVKIVDRIDRPELAKQGMCNYLTSIDVAASHSGSDLFDYRLNRLYTHAHSVKRPFYIYSNIHLPTKAPAWAKDRSALWNAVEKHAGDNPQADLALDVKLYMPLNMSKELYSKMPVEFLLGNLIPLDMICDVNVHLNKTHEPHSHILVPLFNVDASGFLDKNNAWLRPELFSHWKQQWIKQFEHLQTAI